MDIYTLFVYNTGSKTIVNLDKNDIKKILKRNLKMIIKG